MAATCLSHALKGSLPLELTTRCKRGGEVAAAPDGHAGCGGWPQTPHRKQPQRGSARWKGDMRTHTWHAHLEALLVLRCRLGAHHLSVAVHHLQGRRIRGSHALDSPPPALSLPAGGGVGGGWAAHPTTSRRLACVSRLLQMDGLSALLRKQCSRVPSARPQRLQGQAAASWRDPAIGAHPICPLPAPGGAPGAAPPVAPLPLLLRELHCFGEGPHAARDQAKRAIAAIGAADLLLGGRRWRCARCLAPPLQLALH